MRHMASHSEIFYAIIKMKYFTVNGDLTELPQNDTQTLIIEKNFSYIKDHPFIRNSHC